MHELIKRWFKERASRPTFVPRNGKSLFVGQSIVDAVIQIVDAILLVVAAPFGLSPTLLADWWLFLCYESINGAKTGKNNDIDEKGPSVDSNASEPKQAPTDQ